MITEVLAAALAASLRESEVEIAVSEIQMERPALREHGDWSSNVALVTAKKVGRNPRELAAVSYTHLTLPTNREV